MPPNTAGLCGIQMTPASPVRTIQGIKKSVADLLSATGETGIAETGRAGLGNFGGSMLVLCVIVAYLLKMPFWWAVLLLCCGFWEDNIILAFENREK